MAPPKALPAPKVLPIVSVFERRMTSFSDPEPSLEARDRYCNMHVPELNVRLSLGLECRPSPVKSFPIPPDLENKSKIEVVYLGDSMVECLKISGSETGLAKLKTSWNAGCGPDKFEDVVHRLHCMFDILQKHAEKDIKLWVIACGAYDLDPIQTSYALDPTHHDPLNLHGRHFYDFYSVIIEACLRIARKSMVIACDVFYQRDVPDEFTDKFNERLKKTVQQVNATLRPDQQFKAVPKKEKVTWVETRHLVGKHCLLEDGVRLNKEGYEIWDKNLWPHVREILGLRDGTEEEQLSGALDQLDFDSF